MLDIVRRQMETRLYRPRIVHQQVYMVETSLYLVSKAPDITQVRQLYTNYLYIPVARFTYNLLSLLLCLCRMMASHNRIITLCGYSLRLFEAHTGTGTGYYCNPTGNFAPAQFVRFHL